MFALFVAFFIYHIRKNKDNKKFLKIFAVFAAVFLIVYKILYGMNLSRGVTLGDVLPLHLCNIVTFAAIPAAFVKSEKMAKLLKGFCFYFGVIFAYVAMVIPEPGFAGMSIFSGTMLGFYGYHIMLVILSICFVSLGEYKPEFKDIPKELFTLTCVSAVMHLINLILRATIYPGANFFYTFGFEGYTLAEFLQELIPFQFIWMIPLLLLVGFFCMLLALVAKLFSKLNSES